MPTSDDWIRLCALLDDDAETARAVAEAASDPETNPWDALIGGLDDAGVLAYLDSGDTGMELTDALAEMPRVRDNSIDVDEVTDLDDLDDAVLKADEILREHGLRLVYLEEEPDAFPLVVVPAENIAGILALAEQLEHVARSFE